MTLALVAGLAHAAPAVQVASVEHAHVQSPSWSEDGARLSFEANFHELKRIELYAGEPREGGFTRVLPRVRPTSSLTAGFKTVPAGAEVAHELAWSPSMPGTWIYAASTDRHDYDLYLSSGATIAAAPGADGLPSWSPDGRRLAWSSARTGEGDLYLLSTDALDQPPQRLTSLPGSSELWASWSPDGRELVFVAHGAQGDNLWRLPSIGAEPERLTTWPGNQIRPTFSPTARAVAFYANREVADRFDLVVVDLGGGEPRVVARGVVPDAHGPCWSPDGRWLIYVADDDPALDPVRATRIDDPSRTTTLDLGTVGHGDLALAARASGWALAVVAQGRRDDPVRDWNRLFVAELPALP